jgi:hypothetical protein
VKYGSRGTLYIAFSPKAVADDSEPTDNDVLIKCMDNKITGFDTSFLGKMKEAILKFASAGALGQQTWSPSLHGDYGLIILS